MSDYTFETLNDKEFEQISSSLDIESIITHNMEREADNERGDESYRETRNLDSIFNSTVDPIDDLFDKE